MNLGRDIVMSRCTPRLKDVLSQRGYRVHEVDVSAFMLAGGGAFCMTLRLDRRAAPAAVPDASQEVQDDSHH